MFFGFFCLSDSVIVSIAIVRYTVHRVYAGRVNVGIKLTFEYQMIDLAGVLVLAGFLFPKIICGAQLDLAWHWQKVVPVLR